MSLYEQRLSADLDALRKGVVQLGTTVRTGLESSVQALLTQDRDLAYRTIIGDNPINRETEHLQAQCHRFIAKHLPSAGHLRFISAVLRMVVHLERMGDYAVTIAREAAKMGTPLAGPFRAEVEAMSRDSFEMLGQALEAFEKNDEALARGTMGFAAQVDRDFLLAFNMLTDNDSESLDNAELFARLVIIMQIERVSDQAKNLCEHVVFAVTGKTKQRRPVRIAVLSTGADQLGPLATAIARRHFAGRAVVSSAGTTASDALDPTVRLFMDDRGLLNDESRPGVIDWAPETWSSFDVLITLNSDAESYLEEVPFHTVSFRWDVTVDDVTEAYAVLYDELDRLVNVMRGPAAE